MKKLILTKTTEVVQKLDGGVHTTLSDRKSLLPNYKELFKAVLDFPDKKVAARVLKAINSTEEISPIIEVEFCKNCSQKSRKIALVDASTQTDGEGFMQHISVGSCDDAKTEIKKIKEETTFKIKHMDSGAPVKRRRRRKIQIPQVIKKSQAQEQQQRNKPILQKRKANTPNKVKNECEKKSSSSLINGKRQRLDSVSSTASIYSALYSDKDLESFVTPEEIKNKMIQEYLIAESIDADGLLPIHSAIIKNDHKQLGRQILVWQYWKNKGLNDPELLADDDEDCLQLAVSEKSSTDIVRMLLSKGSNVNCQDSKSNTIIHLAILNEASRDVFTILMEKIDIKSLLVHNDDGYTPLHLAVRQDEFMLAECMFDVLDKRFLGRAYYDRDEIKSKQHFKEFYESRCVPWRFTEYKRAYNDENLKQKRELIDAGDVRSGSSALLFAIENGMEHFIYFLLAHLAYPKEVSLSGQSPLTYMNEFGKCLNLTLKIYDIMEQILSELPNSVHLNN